MPNSLDFAGIPTTIAEIVDVHRHAAEKLQHDLQPQSYATALALAGRLWAEMFPIQEA